MPFVEEEFARKSVQVSELKRNALDAQALQYLKRSLSKSASFTIGRVKSAYKAMKAIKENHGKDKLRDMVEIDRKWANLRFLHGFDPNRFVYEFNNIVRRFAEHDVVHSDQYLVVAFIQRLEGIFQQVSPLAFFYKTLSSEGINKLRLNKLQTRFVALGLNTKEGREDSSKRKQDDDKHLDRDDDKHLDRQRRNDNRSRSCGRQNNKRHEGRRSRSYLGRRFRRHSSSHSQTNTRSNQEMRSSSTSQTDKKSGEKSISFLEKYTSEQREKLSKMSEQREKLSKMTP